MEFATREREQSRESASPDVALERARRELAAELAEVYGGGPDPLAALTHALRLVDGVEGLAPEARLDLAELALDLYPDVAEARSGDAGLELAREISAAATPPGEDPVPAGDERLTAEVQSALNALARLVGLAAPESSADRLDYIFDTEPARAGYTADLLDGFSGDLGLAPGSVSVHLDDEAAAITRARGVRGLYDGDAVYLDPFGYGEDRAEDGALLAHELIHAAQARLAPAGASLAAAEDEAYGLMEEARAHGRLMPPTEALPAGARAACGPQGQADSERRRRDPDPHPDPEPAPTDTPTPTPEPDNKEEKKREDKEPDPKGGEKPRDDAEACLDACPDAAEGLKSPKVRTPAAAAPGEGKIVKLNIAGHVVRVRLPGDARPGQVTVRFRKVDSPFDALRLHTAVLQLDESFAVIGGAVRCSVKLGSFVDAPSVSLAVKRGGAVAVRIRGAKVAIRSHIKGTVDLDVNHHGISGEASFTASQIKLGDGLVIEDGAMRVAVEAGGEVHAHGRLAVAIPGLGRADLDACYVKGEFRGKLSLTLTKRLPIAPGVVVEEITLSGCYRRGAWSIGGAVTVGVRERFGATVRATYYYEIGGGSWEVEGRVDQRQPLTFGELELFDGHAQVAWRRDHLEPGEAHFGFQWRQLSGTVDGLWDIANNEVSARGEATLDEPIALGETGAKLDQATLTATVERNVPMAVEGDATVLLPYRAVDTFRVNAHAIWRIQEDRLDADGTVTVLRDVSFGDEAALHAVVKAESQGGFVMTDGAITHLGGGVGFRVSHGEHEVGLGLVTFNGGSATELDGDARFALTQRTGIPEVAAGPFFLLPGGELALTIAKSELTNAEAIGIAWEMLHPSGTGEVAGTVAGAYDFGTGEADLRGDAHVVEPWQLAEGPWGGLRLEPGGEATVDVKRSQVDELAGALPFHLDVNPVGPVSGFSLEGQLDAAVDPSSWEVTGGFEGALLSDLDVTVPGTKGDLIRIGQGGALSGRVAKSAPESAQIAATIGYYRGGSELFLEGRVANARYDVVAGEVGFDASLTLKQAVEVPLGAGWRLTVEPEVTTVSTAVAQNRLESVEGDLLVTVADAEGPLLSGALARGSYNLTAAIPELSGLLTLALARPISVPKATGLPPAISMEARIGSAISATLTANALGAADIDLTVDVGLAGEVVGVASLGGTWDTATDAVTGTGLIVLVEDVVLSEGDGGAEPTGWGLAFLRDSMVALSVVAGELVPAAVNVGVGLRREGDDVARGSVLGAYVFGDEGGFSGELDLHMVSDLELGAAGRFTMLLGGDTQAHGVVEDSRVTQASGTFVLLAREGEVDKVALSLETTYTGGAFDGTAALRVIAPLRLGSRGLGIHQYAVELAVGSGGEVQITQNAPTSASGDLILDVVMDETPFARGTFAVPPVDLTAQDTPITAEGALELFQSVELGQAGDFTFFLDAGSGIVGRIDGSALSWLDGQLQLGLATATEGRVASATLAGRYEGGEEPRFDGLVALVVSRGFLLGYEAFGYEFGLAPSNLSAVLEAGQITSATGKIDVLAQQRGGDDEAPLGTITVHLEGSYDRPLGAAQGHFFGEGSCDVSGELRVGDAGEYELFVLGGSGVRIDVADNRFTRLQGALVARVDQKTPKQGETAELLELRTDVTYVPEDGGRVDASGAVALIGRKNLLTRDGYSFWLIEDSGGTGATVELVDNVLIAVGGRVSAAVYDGESEPLITAHADGTWDRATNDFSGSGDLRLGHAVTFPEQGASGPKITLHAGSGGSGVVTKNHIDELTGTLDVTVYDGDTALVQVTAEGSYDAVHNTLDRATGAAVLIHPLYLGGESERDALLVVHALYGDATIEDGALVAVSGGMDFTVPKLGGLTGHVHGGWTNASGRDEYWGDGTLDFAILGDADKGRELAAQVGIHFERDGSWLVDAQLDYHLTPYLKTLAHLTMDEELDPEIDAGFDVEGATLLEPHDLFSTNLTLFKVSSGIISGGVTAGVHLSTEAMKLATDFEVQGWHPLPKGGEAQPVPDFATELKLTWGADFAAEVGAYIQLGLDVLIASLGGGVKGAVGIDVPADVSVTGAMTGGKDGLKGSIDLGLALAAFITLSVAPYVTASFLWWDWTKEWPLSERLGPIFELSWGQRVTFGDVEEAPAPIAGPAAAPRDGGHAISRQTRLGQEPPKVPEQAPSPPKAPPSGPQIGADMDPKEGAPDEKPRLPGGLGDAAERYKPILMAFAELTHLIELAEPLIDKLKDNPVGALIDLARGASPTWEQLSEAAHKVYAAAQAAWAAFREEVDDREMRRILDDLLGPKPDLLDALFGADDAVRAEVAKGTHRDDKLGPKERAGFINTMMSGMCGDEDEDAILKILHFSADKGEIHSLLAHVDGGVDELLWKLDGRQDDELRELLDKARVRY